VTERKHVGDPCRHRYGQTLEMIYRTPGVDIASSLWFANLHMQAMARLLQVPLGTFLLLSCALNASAHGNGEHAQVVVAPDADWPTRHMAGTGTRNRTPARSLTKKRGASYLGVRRCDLLHAPRLRQHRHLDSARHSPHVRSRRPFHVTHIRDQEGNSREDRHGNVRH
jgi:hypothetical protein